MIYYQIYNSFKNNQTLNLRDNSYSLIYWISYLSSYINAKYRILIVPVNA